MEKLRVALVTNMLPPYRLEFYEELGHQCEFLVISDVYTEQTRSWTLKPEDIPFPVAIGNGLSFGYNYNRDDRDYEREKVFHLSNKTIPLLRKFKPDAVVSAELGLRSWQAMFYCRRVEIPFLIYSEATRVTAACAAKWRVRLRKSLVSRVTRFWCNGKDSRDFLCDLGVSPEKIDMGLTGVSTEAYLKNVDVHLEKDRDAVRAEMGLKGTVLVFVGDLTRRKGIHLLLDGLTRMLDQGVKQPFSLLFVGDGETRSLIAEWSADHAEVPVHVTGFVQPEEIYRYYAVGDLFVMPTTDDCWPLATLEATAARLPQLFSIYNGATAELCAGPEFGWEIDPLDPEGFVTVLSKVITEPLPRLRQDQVMPFVDFYSPKMQAKRGRESIEKALDDFRRDQG